MKKVLGLDLGVTSIGWALISENDNEVDNKILGIGCRIIPYSSTEDNDFTKGSGESKCQKRTIHRTQRKMFDRYQLRRTDLVSKLRELKMLPSATLFTLDSIGLYSLRDKALQEKLSLEEIGRIFFHLNQKRGYKHARSDESEDKKETQYVLEVNSRYDELRELKMTVGQLFYQGLKSDRHYRIKNKVYPRKAYEEEFDKIWVKQKEFYPETLTDEVYQAIRNEIIFYQRKLKSCKHLINICEFEGKFYRNTEGKEIFSGPRVAPKTSPLFQITKIWESINNIKLKNRRGIEYIISPAQKEQLFKFLDNNKTMTSTDLRKQLGIEVSEGYSGGQMLSKGIQGNTTKFALKKAFEGVEFSENLFDFNVKKETYEKVDILSGEIISRERITASFENQNLYKLWHIAYSLKEKAEIAAALKNQFGIENEEVTNAIYKLDFVKPGFGNKSSRAMRKILPYLEQGFNYADACVWAGYNHSDSMTTEENLRRRLLNQLPNLSKNSLRQPVVEKILNQLINLVNAIINEYGRPDEIRVELARELKHSKDERSDSYRYINNREKENNKIADRLRNEYGLPATRKQIEKWRLFEEIDGDNTRINGCCLYCGKNFGMSKALNGEDVEVEHIIPRSLFFDDSLSNKTLSHRSCNLSKGSMTAYDFMKTKSDRELTDYIERIDKLFSNRTISKTKRERLLTTLDKIPTDFISRQLRETQYIARKSREILMQVCHDVHSTSGSVTESLRRIWGWDKILMQLHIDKYREAGLTEWVTIEKDGQIHQEERIKLWTKRDDQRHHAIDALTIACTRQGYIQRLNTLASQHTRDIMFAEVQNQSESYKERLRLYEQWMQKQFHFPTHVVKESVSNILISFKPGKKVATSGKRVDHKKGKTIVLQKGIIVPRGALSEESVYGKIKTLVKGVPVKKLFEDPTIIVNKKIKNLIEERLESLGGDARNAAQSISKQPIYLDKERSILLTHASVFKQEIVIKYPVNTIKAKDLEYVVDKQIQSVLRNRIEKFGEKDAFKDLEKNPVFADDSQKVRINSVRCFAKLDLDKIAAVKFNQDNEPIGYAKPGNNHHIAIYKDETGKLIEHIVTFWHAVERKKYGITVIIKNPETIWQNISGKNLPESFLAALPDPTWIFVESMQQNEIFMFGITQDSLEEIIRNGDLSKISPNLFRVQKIATKDYYFRHHLETTVDDKTVGGEETATKLNKLRRVCSLSKMTGIKVNVNQLGIIKLAYQ